MARSRASRVARRVLPDHRAAGPSAPAVSCSQRRAAAAHTTPESASGPAGRALRGAVPVVGAKPGLSTSILPFPQKIYADFWHKRLRAAPAPSDVYFEQRRPSRGSAARRSAPESETNLIVKMALLSTRRHTSFVYRLLTLYCSRSRRGELRRARAARGSAASPLLPSSPGCAGPGNRAFLQCGRP